jgi:hypothetical protein
MVKRFNNLDAALKFLRPTSAQPDDIAPAAPAGTPLAKYQSYKSGQVALTYTQSATSNPGAFNVVSVLPFAFAAADTTAIKTSVSKRAITSTNLTLFGLSEAELGIDTSPPDTTISTKGFIPAKAICTNVTGTTATAKTSKITGLAYKTKANASYTFPVGRTSGNPSWAEQKAAIIGQVAAQTTGNKSVTFKPEKF